jgi:3-hydroxyacyl-CoA dehydrogenase/enoyl-CoA hydratase/3-hydroxybutyryl-CoA epimerase
METDSDGVLWLTFDRQGTSVNSMNREVFDEFSRVIDDIAQQKPKGVVIVSGKAKGFIAGADITQFTALKNSREAFDLIRQAQLVLDKLEALPMPTVAMINGFCLGGGLEVSLACRYRVAEDSDSTLIGLPEVKLGIHPGWGGTVRLPRLIGAPAAMQIMLPGEPVPARTAAKIGIVDVAVPLRELKRAASFYALHQPKPHQPKGLAKFSNAVAVRPLLGKLFYKKLAQKVNREHYPAPYAIVHNWIKEGVGKNALITEAKSIAELMMTETSRNLVRVFFLQDQLKGLAKGTHYFPKQVHVVGAGTMGGDIAAWCALRGAQVTLQDQTAEKIAPAIKRAYALYQRKLKLPYKIQAVMDRLTPDITGEGVKQADLIIEAVFEDLKVKQQIFKQLEQRAKDGAILATNTSSIPLDEINAVLAKPENLVGIHYFNPVAKMPLVEVVHGEKTSPEVAKQAIAFVSKTGKLPLPVTSSPGFCINRILMPYLMEAMQLLEEGASPISIDKAATEFGMPMGPIALADKVGLDICLSVAKNLTNYYGGEVPPRLEKMVSNGQLGVKSGKGFYRYQNGKMVKSSMSANNKSVPDMTDRMILRLLNEAVAVLHEKVVANGDLLDGGMVFGTGFAPFRGGPINYAKNRGVNEIVQTLGRFAQQYGKCFSPHRGWQDLLVEKTAKN